MGTKRNPGPIDCYANAEPDEPIFVMRGKDRHAPRLVRAWAAFRREEGEDPAIVQGAFDIADAMDLWRAGHRPAPAPEPEKKKRK
jgi:hypothetical protein